MKALYPIAQIEEAARAALNEIEARRAKEREAFQAKVAEKKQKAAWKPIRLFGYTIWKGIPPEKVELSLITLLELSAGSGESYSAEYRAAKRLLGACKSGAESIEVTTKAEHSVMQFGARAAAKTDH